MIDLPDEYPDETVYSLAARYADRYKFPSIKTTYKALFGVELFGSITALPKQLEHLTNSLPENYELTIQKLILYHSLLPYQAPFLPEEKLSQTILYMTGSTQEDKKHGIPKSISPRKLPDWLRYCPVCAENDRSIYGETYWHRIHQVNDVYVCPIHKVFLINSSVLYKRTPQRNGPNGFSSAENMVNDTLTLTLSMLNETHQKLLRLATDAQWLLSNPVLKSYQNEIYATHRREIKLLHSNPESHPTVNEIISIFADFFPNDFLEFVGLPPEKKRMRFIKKILIERNIAEPLKHLLLINLWGYSSVEDFFKSLVKKNYFRFSPWPCLNPFCRHYLERVITEEQITVEFLNGYPFGTFPCDCGFIYRRKGPDVYENEVYNVESIVEHGKLWDKNFKELYQNSNLSLGELRQLLNHSSSHALIKLQAVRLDVQHKRKTIIPRHFREFLKEFSPYPYEHFKQGDDLTVIYRSAWQGLCNTYPNAPQKTLITRGKFIYDWLEKNDSKWLQENMPKTPMHFPKIANWKVRDNEIASNIQKFAQKELNSPKYPRRITYDMLSNEIELCLNKKMPAHTSLKRMPHSIISAQEAAETRLQFAARRILWHSQDLLSKKQIYTRHDLLHYASVSWKFRREKLIEDTLDIAMERLHNQTQRENP